jgi:predicted ATP-dependent serine protease
MARRDYCYREVTINPRQVNMALKLAIVASRQSQRALSLTTAIGEVRLSGIVHGRVVATVDEQRRLAKALGRSRKVLFPTTTTKVVLVSDTEQAV